MIATVISKTIITSNPGKKLSVFHSFRNDHEYIPIYVYSLDLILIEREFCFTIFFKLTMSFIFDIFPKENVKNTF
jgi:hypothetical protein